MPAMGVGRSAKGNWARASLDIETVRAQTAA